MKLLKIICILLILILGIALFLQKNFLTKILPVKNIICKTQYGPCENEDYKLVDRFYGESLMLVSETKIREEVLQNFKNESVVVHKIIPNTLSLIVEKRRAYAAVTKDGLGGDFVISRNGSVLSFVQNSALPILNLGPEYKNPVVGENVTEEITRSLRIVYLTSKIREVGKATLSQSRLTIDSEGTTIVYPEDGDPEILVGALQLIVSRAKMESKMPVNIDLRFKNPVLKY